MTYHIARINDEGRWEVLDTFPLYEEADAVLDSFCDMYPNTLVDIVDFFDWYDFISRYEEDAQ